MPLYRRSRSLRAAVDALRRDGSGGDRGSGEGLSSTAMVTVAALVAVGVAATDAPEQLTCAVGTAISAVSADTAAQDCGTGPMAGAADTGGSGAAGDGLARSGEVRIQSVIADPSCTEVPGTQAMPISLTWCTFPDTDEVTVCTEGPAEIPGDPTCGTALATTSAAIRADSIA